GEWTQFTPDNSRLPSLGVNRIYRIGGRLAVCTNAGLAIIPLSSQKYDEFKNRDLGRVSAKTIFPFPDIFKALVPINHLVRKNDFWVASEKGLSRFVSASGLFRSMLNDEAGILSKRPDTSGLREEEQPESVDNRSEGDAPIALSGERVWDFFTKENFLGEELSYPLPSNKITRLAGDESGHAWMIFEESQLSRLNMVRQPGRPDQRGERVDKPEWYHFTQAAPWSGGVKLAGLWFSEGQLFVGTQSEGYYVLTNPGYSGEKANEWDWKHFGELEGLTRKHVIGFAWRRVPQSEPMLAVLHPDGLSLFDGKDFHAIDLGGGSLRHYRSIVGDPLGNLWMASDAGLIRLTPEWKVLTYTRANANFLSDRITAIAVGSEGKANGISVWAACDQDLNGSDQPPNVVTRQENGRTVKIVQELDIDGASLHYFDGLTWDYWKIPGVRCMYHEGDFLWLGTNWRLRRLSIPALMP
ncbi:MAG TPA: hypothetical protein PKO06_17210, partial [Candidatus Ozemobacteraceae bacterium]|nr:hypothetical protein [Candidatus Ozemobacteraceae bacterium]